MTRGEPRTAAEAGARLARHAAKVALTKTALARGMPRVRAAKTRPLIRIAVNADSRAKYMPAGLALVESVLFDFVPDDQDHFAGWLRRGEVSVAMTSRAQEVHGCDTARLGRLRYRATCAPGFRDRWFANDPTPEGLSAAPAIRFHAKDRLQRDWAGRACGVRLLLPPHLAPSAAAFVEAALRGIGWGTNPEAPVLDDLAAGTLVALSGPSIDLTLH